ncbi:MAG: HemK2/MTQ2 family protein methyltransferase [archaeon]
MKKVFYRDITLEIFDQVYEPREDSFLLAEVVEKVLSGGGRRGVVGRSVEVLDIGTGSGMQAIIAAKLGANVVATDINQIAIECAEKNAEKNNVEIDLRKGDMFWPVRDEKFDLIIFNAPYLPEESAPEEKELIDYSYAGAGRIKEFLEEYQNHLKTGGCALLVFSSLSGINVLGEIIARKKVAFEEICVARLTLSQE